MRQARPPANSIRASQWGVARGFFLFSPFNSACPKYITPRYTAGEIQELVGPIKQRIAELEAELKNRN